MTTMEKLAAVGKNQPKVFEAGKQKAKEVCLAQHFAKQVVGDGSQKLQLHIPFEPDQIFVTGFYPSGYKKANAISLFAADLASFSYIGALSTVYTAGGTLGSSVMTTVSVRKRYQRAEDGIVTIENVVGSPTSTVGFFEKGMPYVVTAVRYDKAPDHERIAEFVRGLTGSGTVMLNAQKVHAAFTEEAWQSLIAEKPDWTFTLN